MQNHKPLILGVLAGCIVGALAMWLFVPQQATEQSAESSEPQPLYWVAPMDSNYRRDKPGKSPMGMDLIPVYADDAEGGDDAPGTVKISPAVVNNLGVRTAMVDSVMLSAAINTVGYVQYDENQLLHIHPRVEGWVEKLFIKAAGEPVEQGQPLYTLYSPQLVNAQEELLIAIKRSNDALVKAAKERLRALQLSEAFIAQLAKTQQVQQQVTFYSPQSGVVDGLQIREGFFVKPGTTLMSIGKLAQVWVEAEVFERDSAKVAAGLPVTMTLDYLPGQEWLGVVDYVYPTLEAKTRTLRVRMKFDNPGLQLKPNMYAQVTIAAQPTEHALVVPKEAVIRTGKQDRVVLALGEGKFKSVAVKTGSVTDRFIEVLAGLEQGDRVVTSAQFLIDSESSKSSDFKRMSEVAPPSQVWAEGNVTAVMPQHRMVTIDHAPIPEWEWPQMVMDFNLAEHLDVNALSVGQTLHFELTREQDGEYAITTIHIMDNAPDALPTATVNGVINQIDAAARVLNISRDAIEKWDRPATTMDFVVAESIDLSLLSTGMEVTFTFTVGEAFTITEIMPVQGHGADHD